MGHGTPAPLELVLAQYAWSVSPVRIWPILKAWYGQTVFSAIFHQWLLYKCPLVWLNILPWDTRALSCCNHRIHRIHKVLSGQLNTFTFQKGFGVYNLSEVGWSVDRAPFPMPDRIQAGELRRECHLMSLPGNFTLSYV